MLWQDYVKRACIVIFIMIFSICVMKLGSMIFIRYNIGIPCMLNYVFGINCATCGMTRAFFAILNLDFYQAIRYNAFSVILLFILISGVIIKSIEYIFNMKMNVTSKIPLWFWISLLTLMISYGIIRNLDEFLFLSPTKIR